MTPYPDQREPEREIELHLTGHMIRYMWSFDGKKYSDAKEPIVFRHGERLRLTFVNDTMMEHPLHLHGMWMHLENGAGAFLPRKHTVIVKPAERVSVAITADAPGRWAFHCHLLFHMEAGMFRVVEVTGTEPEAHSVRFPVRAVLALAAMSLCSVASHVTGVLAQTLPPAHMGTPEVPHITGFPQAGLAQSCHGRG